MQPEYREGKLLLKFKSFFNALSVSGVVLLYILKTTLLTNSVIFICNLLNGDHINDRLF